MDKIFEIHMAGETVRAALLTGEAPETCAAFERAMPTSTFGVNAKFAGDETIAMLPFYAPRGRTRSPPSSPGTSATIRAARPCAFSTARSCPSAT